jgi:signal-transduction protein with cAMP-binding, CBS, and nucleotidyltransferase domain
MQTTFTASQRRLIKTYGKRTRRVISTASRWDALEQLETKSEATITTTIGDSILDIEQPANVETKLNNSLTRMPSESDDSSLEPTNNDCRYKLSAVSSNVSEEKTRVVATSERDHPTISAETCFTDDKVSHVDVSSEGQVCQATTLQDLLNLCQQSKPESFITVLGKR